MPSRSRNKPPPKFNKYKYIHRYSHKSKKYTPLPSPDLTNSNTHTNIDDNNTNSNSLDTTTIPSPAKIIPINADKEELENLKKLLASNDSTKKEKAIMIRRITGACVTCAGISEYYLIYDLDGCSKIERYCGPCVEKEKEKKMEIANLMSNFDFPNISK